MWLWTRMERFGVEEMEGLGDWVLWTGERLWRLVIMVMMRATDYDKLEE